MTFPVYIIVSSSSSSTPFQVGGLPLVNRYMLEFSHLGVSDFHLCGVAEIPRQIQAARMPRDCRVHLFPLTSQEEILRVLWQRRGDALLVRSDCLVDPRLLASLLQVPEPHWLRFPTASTESLPAALRLTSASRDGQPFLGLDVWLRTSSELCPAALNPYSPSHRGVVPFYVLPVTTPSEARTATQTLIRSTQKRALDLPAEHLDPLFENPLVSWLCTTPVTPNQVTLFATVVGAGITLLFLNGWLRLGILATYAVEVLDGVDGKLARTKLQTSRLGEMEHVLDFFVEQAWYASITFFLATSTGRAGVWWLGGGLMLCDIVDNLLYGMGKLYLGTQLDELSPFDRKFRLIAGRRNIYCWMFLFGFLAGFPLQTLAVVALWSFITAATHGFRLLYRLFGKRRRRGADAHCVPPINTGKRRLSCQ